MRLAWLTEIHLNFVSTSRFTRLVEDVRSHRPDAVLRGGDIGEAKCFVRFLTALSERVSVPGYFVLGNHDYYHGSIANVRRAARALSDDHKGRLIWLPAAGVVQLTDRTALVGHGGWGDGRAGDFFGSDVILNDYVLIEELHRACIVKSSGGRGRSLPRGLFDRLNALGDDAADRFRTAVPQALSVAEHVIVLTHVPPFREACRHEGRTSDDNWSPHFVCLAVGHVLREAMSSSPQQRMTVLCGHTHGKGRAEILPNLHVLTGGARYGEPQVQQLIDVE